MKKPNVPYLFYGEGKFEPTVVERVIRSKAKDSYSLKIGDWKFDIWKLNKDTPGWGWDMYHNGQHHHFWEKGDYDHLGNLLNESKPDKSRNDALKKCLLGALRWGQQDQQRLLYMLERTKK